MGVRRLLGSALLPGTVAVAVAALCGGCAAPKRVSPPPSPAGGSSVPVPTPSAAAAGAPLLVRVGLAVDAPTVSLRVEGPALLLDEERRRVGRLDGAGTVEIVARGGWLRWRAEPGGSGGSPGALFVQPIDPATLLRWDGRPYPGEALLLAAPGGVTLVDVVDLEQYLRGVVPWEIGRPGPEARAAVEAQAVAARTYTIAHLGERAGLGFDVWADVRDQVYRGAAGRDPLCDEAVAATAGLVLRYEGREIEAYYCSTCGGRTSDIAEVWPREPRPYLRSHPDAADGGEPFCAGSRRYAWRESWRGEELERILARTLPEYLDHMGEARRAEWAGPLFTPRERGADPRRPGRLRGLRIATRASCGRVARLDVDTDAGVYHLRGDRVRWVLAPADGNPTILWSDLFDLEVEAGADGRPARVTATGRGFGHGIGMCQAGALGMAARGYDLRRILAHYYPGTRLERTTAAAAGRR